jgi:DNA-binding CsgD family transcriptional regulator
VDSPKRRTASYIAINDHDTPEDWPEGLWERVAKDSSFEVIAARDLVQVLQQWLTPPEREILSRWADGLGPCETARQLRLSHTGVAQKRRRIAALLRALTAGTPSRRAS